jgi:hypothetical protein
MFGSIYAKALELFGRSFLVAAFVPTMIVAAGLTAMIAPLTFDDTLRVWMKKDLGDQVTPALLVLLILYLFAFVIFGIRERVTRILSSGEFWVLRSLRRRRRVRFTQELIEAKQEAQGPGLAVANAIAWIETGLKGRFLPVERKYVHLPKNFKAEKLDDQVRRHMKRLRALFASKSLQQDLPAVRRAEMAEVFVALHRLAFIDRTMGELYIGDLQELCRSASPPIDLADWCRDVKDIDYGDIVDAFERRLWSPPLRNVQPTELGNILIWASVYSRQRYGIELEFLYPRLLKVIDKEYEAKMGERQQFFDFAVLFTFLSFVAAIVYGAFAVWFLTGQGLWRDWQEVVGAIGFVGLWVVVGRVAYNVALVAARGYVAIVTSAIDLFRLPLLKALEITQPTDAWTEYEIWSKMNRVIETGQRPQKPPAGGA